ncbi:hypothetical protein AALP_AA8G435200 [Arabis alpina]|uniref:Uncharacterized protein n=1 Tax=Arabis alpina TaxID=50452 RepID=A0A087GD76_ARAAL|nr:hypothetical protein AALP_AA8G435200 [Arabis alpina]
MNSCFHLHCSTPIQSNPIQSAPRQSKFETAPISFLQEEESSKQEDIQVSC